MILKDTIKETDSIIPTAIKKTLFLFLDKDRGIKDQKLFITSPSYLL